MRKLNLGRQNLKLHALLSMLAFTCSRTAAITITTTNNKT